MTVIECYLAHLHVLLKYNIEILYTLVEYLNFLTLHCSSEANIWLFTPLQLSDNIVITSYFEDYMLRQSQSRYVIILLCNKQIKNRHWFQKSEKCLISDSIISQANNGSIQYTVRKYMYCKYTYKYKYCLLVPLLFKE